MKLISYIKNLSFTVKFVLSIAVTITVGSIAINWDCSRKRYLYELPDSTGVPVEVVIHGQEVDSLDESDSDVRIWTRPENGVVHIDFIEPVELPPESYTPPESELTLDPLAPAIGTAIIVEDTVAVEDTIIIEEVIEIPFEEEGPVKTWGWRIDPRRPGEWHVAFFDSSEGQ